MLMAYVYAHAHDLAQGAEGEPVVPPRGRSNPFNVGGEGGKRRVRRSWGEVHSQLGLRIQVCWEGGGLGCLISLLKTGLD